MINKPTSLNSQNVLTTSGELTKAGDEIGMLCLSAGDSAAATLNVRKTNVSGDIVISLKATAGTTVCLPLTGPLTLATVAYAQISGTGAVVSFGKY
jgi:hypothetical protein